MASCSFGKDSIAAIITYIQNGGYIDEAVYCRIMFDKNISAELPEHEDWIYSVAIPKLEKDWGVKTVIVQANKTYLDCFYKKKQKGKYKGSIYGFPFKIGSWCNNRLKTDIIRKYFKNIGKYKEIIGLTVDEPRRMPKKRNNFDVILPLVEHNITQEQSFIIAKNAKLLSPAYGGYDKAWMLVLP